MVDNVGILITLTLISYTYTINNILTNPQTKTQTNASARRNTQQPKWKFEDYMKKFEPSVIWEQIDKQRKYNGRNISDAEQMDIMCRAMDPTNEFMKLPIENGDAKMILESDGRRGWRPPQGIRNAYYRDRFYVRRRLYELMKQAIYQTRNKMVGMQIYREKYSESALYRMGFLMNRADNAAKAFGQFSFRAFRSCLLYREEIQYRGSVSDVLSTHERQLNLWFNLDLLTDLIKRNDEVCKEVFENNTKDRKHAFNLAFKP